MRTARRLGLLFAALLSAALLAAPTARADEWTYQPEDVEARSDARLRFATDLGLWIANFDRPARACDPTRVLDDVPIAAPNVGGYAPRPSTSACSAGRSSEVGLATGVSVAFRVASPVHLTAGLELMYTSPSNALLKNQLVVPIPFGLLVTPYTWAVRPILHATLTPILYVTDDSRDYTFGLDAGLAWRVMSWGDLSLTAGYRGAQSMDAWRVEVALHPVP